RRARRLEGGRGGAGDEQHGERVHPRFLAVVDGQRRQREQRRRSQADRRRAGASADPPDERDRQGPGKRREQAERPLGGVGRGGQDRKKEVVGRRRDVAKRRRGDRGERPPRHHRADALVVPQALNAEVVQAQGQPDQRQEEDDGGVGDWRPGGGRLPART